MVVAALIFVMWNRKLSPWLLSNRQDDRVEG